MQTLINNNRIPSPGDNSNLFQRLSSYITKVDPDWINRIKPASQESINLLRKLSGLEDAGLDLPEAYKIFLEYMGEDDGGMMDSLNGDTFIGEIIDFYKEVNEENPDELNPQYLAFLSTYFGGQISFEMSKPDNPSIVMASEGRRLYFFSESFEKLLFQYTFAKYEIQYYPARIAFGGSQNMLKMALDRHKITNIFDVVDRHAKRNGFQKAWFSDDRHYIGICDDATFFVRRDSNVSGIDRARTKIFKRIRERFGFGYWCRI